jgi:hypothetical protein
MDDRRELAYIFRQYDRFTASMGEEVEWFELDVAATTTNSVYDEPGNRVYKPPVRVTMIQIDESEPIEEQGHEGRHSTGTLRAGVTAKALREAGVSVTHGNAPKHLNDVLYWNGRYFAVSSFQIRGRVRGDVMIGITAVETMEAEEYVFDVTPPTNPAYEPTAPD